MPRINIANDWKHDSEYVWVYPNGGTSLPYALEAEIESVYEPNTYLEAINGTYHIRWKKSMDKEIADLLKHQTWETVSRSSLPAGRKPLKSKWVYKIKYNRDGTIERFKSRFVVCGYSQREGIDYDQAFSSTLRASSFRLLLALSAAKGMRLGHMDVTNAFTQAIIDDVELFVEPAKGYEEYERDGATTKVLKLKRALYGTKQASRLWQNTLRTYLVNECKFTCSLHDPCLFVRWTGNKVVVLGIYVDDIIVAYNDTDTYERFKREFTSRFNSKDLGKLQWFLGMSVDQHVDSSVVLGQQKYIEDMVRKFYPQGIENTIARDVPCRPEDMALCGFAEDDVERSRMRDVPFLQLMGSLLYASVMSRPDIDYYVGHICTFMHEPNEHCYKCAMDILLYLYRSREKRIRYSPGVTVPNALHLRKTEISNNMGFHAYSDSSWNVPYPRFGFVLFLANGPISFASKALKCADSSCEAEYTACSKSSRDISFIRALCDDLGFTLTGRLVLAVDNTAALDVARNLGVTARNKHYDREIHYFREQTELRRVVGHHVFTQFQVADIFTKALDKTTFLKHRDRLLC